MAMAVFIGRFIYGNPDKNLAAQGLKILENLARKQKLTYNNLICSGSTIPRLFKDFPESTSALRILIYLCQVEKSQAVPLLLPLGIFDKIASLEPSSNLLMLTHNLALDSDHSF